MGKYFVLVFLSVYFLTYGQLRGKSSVKFNSKDWSKPYSKEEWRAFHKQEESAFGSLWEVAIKQGVPYKKWFWGWKLAWIRTCAKSSNHYCHGLLKESLFDNAFVVKSQALSVCARYFKGSKDKEIKNTLVSIYESLSQSEDLNLLKLRSKALYALFQLGGSDALRSGGLMSRSSKEMGRYWQTLMGSKG